MTKTDAIVLRKVKAMLDGYLLCRALYELLREYDGQAALDGDYIQKPDGKLDGSKPGGGKEGEEIGRRDIGKLLGKEHIGVKGQAAVDLLLKEKNGHVKGAFYRPQIGHIDLIWGDDSVGLKHIISRRAKQNIDPQHFVADISSVISNGTIKKTKIPGQGIRYKITKGDKTAVIATEVRGAKMTYVLTAFQA